MSYQEWTTHGFGFRVDDILQDTSITMEKVLKLAAMEPSVFEIVQEKLSWICERDEATFDELDISDLNEIEGDYCERGLAFILYNVITEIPIVYADCYDACDYILYTPTYPWQMSDKERNITEKDVVDIFAKYIRILTDNHIAIDYYSVTNGG